jgi:hypothetical protein
MTQWRRPDAARIRLLATRDLACADLVRRLLGIGVRAMPRAYLGGEFGFTLRPARTGLLAEGTSVRYSAIAALGLRCLAEADQREALAGDNCDDLIELLAKRLDELTALGDVALICLAAAEAGHSELPHAIDRLRELDRHLLVTGTGAGDVQVDAVSAAWVVTALVAARAMADVEQHLAAARRRLLSARGALFPHLIGGGQSWYRAHVGSFADQIYPVQALARLHASADDPIALQAADQVAARLCRMQGRDGQWWWHYDARHGDVVEHYPVYSVHQHAMAPMALLDLADAGGACHLEAICRGLRWLAAPPEVHEHLVDDDLPVIWRKVARNDPGKLVRGLAAVRTAIWPGPPGPAIGRLFPPTVVDRECRPYELGWLLYAWLHENGSRS